MTRQQRGGNRARISVNAGVHEEVTELVRLEAEGLIAGWMHQPGSPRWIIYGSYEGDESGHGFESDWEVIAFVTGLEAGLGILKV